MNKTIEFSRGFKKSTIVKVIEEKISDWTKTLPETLAIRIKNNYILSGGAICSMLQGDLPNDYDIYLQDSSLAEDLANHYLKDYVSNSYIHLINTEVSENRVKIMIKSSGIVGEETDSKSYRYFEQLDPAEMKKFFKTYKKKEKPTYKPLNITSNAITLDGDIQIVLRFIGAPEQIHKTFDFVHATNYYTELDGLVTNKQALECILAKELKYQSSEYPICAMFRTRKFINRGWTITAGEMFKIAYDISQLDLNNIDVLAEQLTGVDQAYFLEIISILRKENIKDINRTYLFELIERVFDGIES